MSAPQCSRSQFSHDFLHYLGSAPAPTSENLESARSCVGSAPKALARIDFRSRFEILCNVLTGPVLVLDF
jgi:hypothetical protein